MDKHPISWGLDIGHSTIKAVKLARGGTNVTVLGYSIEPINVPEGGDRDEAVVKALQHLAAREEFGNTPVVAALSGRQVLTKTVNIPVLNAKKVDKMVELEARQQIPGDFNEIEWGYHLSPGADGASNDVALFAVKREIIQELIAKAKRAGINLTGVSVSSLALYNFVSYDQVFPADETVIILDVGAENTDLVFYQGDALFLTTLSVSGNDITKAFAKKFRVSPEEAETLKRQVNDSRQADKIIKVIEGSLNELTGEVQRRVGFYKSQRADAKLDNLVISGNTFRLPGLPEYMAERLRFTVNILEDLDRIQVAPGLERDHFLHDLQSLGVAMGLALQGTGVSRADVNLLPGELKIEKILKSKRWAAAAIVAMVGVAFVARYNIVAARMEENVAIANQVRSDSATNAKRSEQSRLVLDQVEPKAQELQSFAPYGSQMGVNHAVLASVSGLIQTMVADYGRIGKPGKPEAGGDEMLQAVYLQAVEVPAFAHGDESGPFRPLAQARQVRVTVSIPEENPKSADIRKRLNDELGTLQVPESIRGIHPGYRAYSEKLKAWRAATKDAKPEDLKANPEPQAPPLFSEVQTTADSSGADSYWYIDRGHLDDSGNAAPIQEERRIRVRVSTFTCTLGGGKDGAL